MPHKDRNQRNDYEQRRRKAKRDEARSIKLTMPREGAREDVIHRMVNSVISSVKTRARQRKRQAEWRASNPAAAKARSAASNADRSATCQDRGITQRQLVAERWDNRPAIVNAAEYKRNRYHSDIEFQLRVKLSNRLYEAISRIGVSKASSTCELVGCSLQELRIHLLNTTDDAVLEGKHVDHIFPISIYNLSSEQFKAMHWSNLRAVVPRTNQEKGDALPSRQLAQLVHRNRWPSSITEADLC